VKDFFKRLAENVTTQSSVSQPFLSTLGR